MKIENLEDIINHFIAGNKNEKNIDYPFQRQFGEIRTKSEKLKIRIENSDCALAAAARSLGGGGGTSVVRHQPDTAGRPPSEGARRTRARGGRAAAAERAAPPGDGVGAARRLPADRAL